MDLRHAMAKRVKFLEREKQLWKEVEDAIAKSELDYEKFCSLMDRFYRIQEVWEEYADHIYAMR